MTREELTRRLLLSNLTEAAQKTGIPLRTLSRRKKHPEGITLPELGRLSRDMEPDTISGIVIAWDGRE